MYMLRCIALAKQGMGHVAPNPMVGAVLVYNNRIIGEGFHQAYGQPHAEVNCINNVKEADKHLISSSALYVSLEPCNHFGKTPPCTNLILKHQIPTVVIGCQDPFEKVNGKGIETLRANNVEVIAGIKERECKALNKRFFLFHKKRTPYIILKWAQTKNDYIAGEKPFINNEEKQQRLMISNQITNRLVHKWRSEEAAILVGTRTALLDNPSLTNRLWHGKNPVRLVIDKNLLLPKTLNMFKPDAPTIIFNYTKHDIQEPLENYVYYYKINEKNSVIKQISDACYHLHLQSILVEGGAILHQSFINESLWNETRIIVNTNLEIDKGVKAPIITKKIITKSESFLNDTITYYHPVSQ